MGKIENYPNHIISKDGVVINTKTGNTLKSYIGSTGYYMVGLSHNNKSNPKRVHRLIANAFIPNPNNKPQINHINGIKTDNSILNLEWCNHSENMEHAFRIGLANNTGEKNGMSKLNSSKVLEIKTMLVNGLSQQKIANKFNVSRSCILKIHLGKTWVHIIC
jgi:DNA-binding NarL/FixJ family response regulator